VLLFFASVLFFSGLKLLHESFAHQSGEEEDLADNFVLRVANYLVPSTSRYDGDYFFTTVKGKKVRRAAWQAVWRAKGSCGWQDRPVCG